MSIRLFLTLLMVTTPFAAMAADGAVPEVTPLTKLDAATKKMMEGLDANKTKQFAAIRSSHGIIRSVEAVEKNILDAGKSCSAKNPEFAKSMNDRIALWTGDIDPVLKDARARLQQMIQLQDFAKPVEAKAYLKKVDDAVAYKGRNVKTIPITEKKECRKLLGKMDDTQEDLKKLLIDNLGLDKPLTQKADAPK